MDKSAWKTIAIIFIILFILSWLFWGFILKLGLDELNKEDKCKNNICLYYDAFSFDGETCYCYEGNEIALAEEIE